MKVYQIHLERPIGQAQDDDERAQRGLKPRQRGYEGPTAQHYIGATNNLKRRLEEHRSGEGAALLRAANEQGVEWEVVRTWDGGYELEKELKAQKNARRLCPKCNPNWERNKST